MSLIGPSVFWSFYDSSRRVRMGLRDAFVYCFLYQCLLAGLLNRYMCIDHLDPSTHDLIDLARDIHILKQYKSVNYEEIVAL